MKGEVNKANLRLSCQWIIHCGKLILNELRAILKRAIATIVGEGNLDRLAAL
jgi:hypothetical protein